MREVRSRPGLRQNPYVVLDQNGVLVVYKPPHWTMTTTMEMPRESSLQAWLGESLGHCYPYLLLDPLQSGLVQRLDVETSGPVVVATCSHTFRTMWQLRSAGHFYREYVALLHGKLPIKHCCGTLEYSLNTRRRSSKVSERHGQPARTRYQAVAAFQRRCAGGHPGRPHGKPQDYTLLRVRILTGRLHQIRVHLKELARRLGLPVCGLVGDYKYLPRDELMRDREFCPRVFLHARVLRFPLPGEQREQCKISCELPVDLAKVLHDELIPNDDLTAEFTKLGDFLRHEHADPLKEPVRTVHMNFREHLRSRSPSHWRAASPREAPEEVVLEERPRSCSPPPQRLLLRSPSPGRWIPPPSSSGASCGSDGSESDATLLGSRQRSSSSAKSPLPSLRRRVRAAAARPKARPQKRQYERQRSSPLRPRKKQRRSASPPRRRLKLEPKEPRCKLPRRPKALEAKPPRAAERPRREAEQRALPSRADRPRAEDEEPSQAKAAQSRHEAAVASRAARPKDEQPAHARQEPPREARAALPKAKPKVEQPSAVQPSTVQPRTVQPSLGQPKAEPPTADQPRSDQPKQPATATDEQSSTGQSMAVPCKAAQPRKEPQPATETIAEQPRAEQPKAAAKAVVLVEEASATLEVRVDSSQSPTATLLPSQPSVESAVDREAHREAFPSPGLKAAVDPWRLFRGAVPLDPEEPPSSPTLCASSPSPPPNPAKCCSPPLPPKSPPRSSPKLPPPNPGEPDDGVLEVPALDLEATMQRPEATPGPPPCSVLPEVEIVEEAEGRARRPVRRGLPMAPPQRCLKSRKRAALATLDQVAKRHRDPFGLWGG